MLSALLVSFGCLALGGCRTEIGTPAQSLGDSVRNEPSTILGAAPGDAGDHARLRPLDGYPWLTTLGKTKSGADVVTPPLGATEPRPIVVAVHGAADRPEWACGGWRIGVEAYPFVVCPVGQPMGNERYAWANEQAIGAATDRALASVRTQFGGYCSPTPMVYVGFSQGATLAARFLIKNADRFPTVVLAEGGYNFVTAHWFAQEFFEAGGRRVLLLCGTPGCLVTAARAQKALEQAGLRVIVAGDSRAGHNLNGAMQRLIQEHWSELVTGVPGWETYGAHRWTQQ